MCTLFTLPPFTQECVRISHVVLVLWCWGALERSGGWAPCVANGEAEATVVETKGQKGSQWGQSFAPCGRFGVPVERPGGYWNRCNSWMLKHTGNVHWRMTVEKSCNSKVEMPWACEASYVSHEWQSLRFGGGQVLWNPDDPEWTPDVGHWAPEFGSYCWIVVFFWSDCNCALILLFWNKKYISCF